MATPEVITPCAFNGHTRLETPVAALRQGLKSWFLYIVYSRYPCRVTVMLFTGEPLGFPLMSTESYALKT